MKKTILTAGALALIAAAGCKSQNTDTAKRQADSLDKRADTVEQRGKDEAKREGDTLHAKADVVKDGVKYEVATIDDAAQTVTFRAKEKSEKAMDKTGIEPKSEKTLQAGKDLVLTFGDLSKYDVEHHKPGADIAKDLHQGEDVTVYMDASGNITKIDY